MKWKTEQNVRGTQRIVSKFLLIPRCLNGEWRWLERAEIWQEWADDPWNDSRAECLKWVNQKWVS